MENLVSKEMDGFSEDDSKGCLISVYDTHLWHMCKHRQEECKFETSLCYLVSTKLAKAIHQDPVLENQKDKVDKDGIGLWR